MSTTPMPAGDGLKLAAPAPAVHTMRMADHGMPAPAALSAQIRQATSVSQLTSAATKATATVRHPRRSPPVMVSMSPTVCSGSERGRLMTRWLNLSMAVIRAASHERMDGKRSASPTTTASATPTAAPATAAAAAAGFPVTSAPAATTTANATLDKMPPIAKATLTCAGSAPLRRKSR